LILKSRLHSLPGGNLECLSPPICYGIYHSCSTPLGEIRNGQLKLLDVNDKVRARIEP
jgi:hypothetical protein